ncbi:YdcH family protein [Paracoccus saliphilus]|uniref:DUF465 domain-containing protein n=1 Tax=Paracoccus saliphilus TaxID=405559 RepID=A0AA46A4X2_9RHOB|nr:DUF465 domain-containing protein [Paracoccus saliphilus]WCR05036.1 DUF465 domain-containing protein [Paracoccus saliphilus]SIS70997.1 hypothetical protein SAMN05421772_103163 [Paracoccus saliphilus]
MNMHHEPTSHEMSHDEIIRAELAVLRVTHRELDQEITTLSEQKLTSTLTLQRLKKQKLALKDQIARLEDEVTPDIIA